MPKLGHEALAGQCRATRRSSIVFAREAAATNLRAPVPEHPEARQARGAARC